MVETGRSERRGEAWRSPAWRCEARRSAAWQGILFEIRKGGRGIMVGKKQEEETITLDEVRWKTIILKAKGITPYIPHRKSTRARKQMEAKQSKKVIEQAARNFDLEYEECFYLLPGGVRTVEGVPAEGEEDGRRRKYGTPAAAFKKAILDTAPMLKGIHKTAIGRSIQIVGSWPYRLADRRARRLAYPARYQRRLLPPDCGRASNGHAERQDRMESGWCQ